MGEMACPATFEAYLALRRLSLDDVYAKTEGLPLDPPAPPLAEAR